MADRATFSPAPSVRLRTGRCRPLKTQISKCSKWSLPEISKTKKYKYVNKILSLLKTKVKQQMVENLCSLAIFRNFLLE